MTLRPPPSWNVPPCVCFVAAVQRCGSNLLYDLMRQTGKLGIPLEYFNPRVLTTVYPGRGETISDCCQLACEEGMTENGVLSIKFFRKHLRSVQRSLRLEEWFGEPRWVWLRRRDIIAQAISWSLAIQSGSFTSGQKATGMTRYSARDIEKRLFALLACNAEWEAYFACTRSEPLCLWYEDVESDPRGAVLAIGRFLDVDLTGVVTGPGGFFERQRSALNDEWRERFHQDCGRIGYVSQFKMEVHAANAAVTGVPGRRLIVPLLRLFGLKHPGLKRRY
jgi:LPS sulfotransferase NodH